MEKPARGHSEEPPLEEGNPSRLPPSDRGVSPSPSAPHSSPPPPPETVAGQLQLRIATWSLLTFATFWGVLARLGLLWLGVFAGREVFVSVWPQVVGCVVMGFVVERKKAFEAM